MFHAFLDTLFNLDGVHRTGAETAKKNFSRLFLDFLDTFSTLFTCGYNRSLIVL